LEEDEEMIPEDRLDRRRVEISDLFALVKGCRIVLTHANQGSGSPCLRRGGRSETTRRWTAREATVTAREVATGSSAGEAAGRAGARH